MVLLLLVISPVVVVNSANNSLIEVEYPNPIPITLESLPIKIVIPKPEAFGYPRIPSEIRVSIHGFQKSSVVISLLDRVNLQDIKSVYEYLSKPIKIDTELPLRIKKIGFYRLIVDVKCLYGPTYKKSFWYSFTQNLPLEITIEKIHIVSGPEVVQRGDKVYGRFYGYSFSQAIIYDWQKKGISFRFKVQVLDSQRNILYEEPAAVIGTCFDSDFSDEYVFNEIKVLEQNYRFLLKQFPDSCLSLRIFYEITSKGNWRYLFGVMPEEWIVKHGVVIEAALPQLQSGESFFPGLQGIEWPGMRWNPEGEFQLEVLSN